MSINSNHGYLAFNQQLDRVCHWLRPKVRDVCGNSAEHLTSRLVQRIAEIGLQPYVAAMNVPCRATADPLLTSGSRIDCKQASMTVDSGRIAVSARQWLKNQSGFVAHWMFCAVAILAGAVARQKLETAVLVHDIADESLFADGSEEEFVRYCEVGPVEPLRVGKHFLIQSTRGHVSSMRPNVTYCQRPLIELLRRAHLGPAGRFKVLANHFFLIFSYFRATIRLPVLSLVGREFAYSRISVELDQRGVIESVVTTCSSFTCQPLWMRALRRSRVHMIWYSQNWKPVTYTSDRVGSDLPALRLIAADVHWVWTRAFASYLQSLGQTGSMHVVAPVVWCRPRLSVPPGNAIRVVIFDVPAVDDEVLLRCCGELTNYFHESKLRSFIQDIVALKPKLEQRYGMRVELQLKSKRGYRSDYNKAYFEHVEALGCTGMVSLQCHTENLFQLISGSNLVVAYPFTSPAYIAEFLKVPAIYYDATESIVHQDFCDDASTVQFASGRNALFAAAIELLDKTLATKPAA